MAGQNEAVGLAFGIDAIDAFVEPMKAGVRETNLAITIGVDDAPGIPVDTGEARAGSVWERNGIPSFRPPKDAEFYPIPRTGRLERELAGLELEDTMFWTDNVEHAIFLEKPKAHSKQAPKGFVDQGIRAGLRKAEKEFVRDG